MGALSRSLSRFEHRFFFTAGAFLRSSLLSVTRQQEGARMVGWDVPVPAGLGLQHGRPPAVTRLADRG